MIIINILPDEAPPTDHSPMSRADLAARLCLALRYLLDSLSAVLEWSMTLVQSLREAEPALSEQARFMDRVRRIY